MNLKQLEYFVEIAKTNSFLQAAENLYISQPTISHAIKRLEENLNVNLFERSQNGSFLTETGQELLPKAQAVLSMIKEIEEYTVSKDQILRGSLSISAVPVMSTFIAKTIVEFKKKHPYVDIMVKEDGTKQTVEDVLSRRVDLGFASYTSDYEYTDNIFYEHLFIGKMLACVGKDGPFSIYKKMPTEVISKGPIVMFKPGYRTSHYLKKILKISTLNILFASGNTEIAKKVIIDGIAIGFYPDFYLKNDEAVKAGKIIPLEIEGDPMDEIMYVWLRLKNYHFSQAAKIFLKMFKETIQGYDLEQES
jgi:DNA-binding transcriptional LysR family regulator